MYGLLVERNRIFGDIFAPPSYSPSGKVLRREEGRKEREERDKERKGGERKKGTKADGKVWRPFLSYRPPNYFRLVNAIFLKARVRRIFASHLRIRGSGVQYRSFHIFSFFLLY